MNWNRILVASFLQCYSSFIYAGTTYSPGETGSKFLILPLSARPTALSGACVSAQGDISNIEYNPAGLAHIEEHQFSGTHVIYPGGPNYSAASLATKPYKGIGGVVRMRILYMDDVQRDGIGQRVGGQNIPIYDRGYTLGVNFLLTPHFSFGITSEFIDRTLYTLRSRTFVTSVGGQMNTKNRRHVLGFSVQNLGNGTKFLQFEEPLPLVYRFGGGHSLWKNYLLLWEIQQYADNPNLSGAAGVEWKVHRYVSIRGGIKYAGVSVGITEGSAGLGFHWKNYSIDYAARPQAGIGTMYNMTVTLKWGEPEEDRLPLIEELNRKKVDPLINKEEIETDYHLIPQEEKGKQ